MGDAQLLVHLPADPEQQKPAREQEAGDRQEFGRDQGEADAHHRGGADADDDRLPAQVGRQAGGGHADDDGVVSGQDQVDHNDLQEGREESGFEHADLVSGLGFP